MRRTAAACGGFTMKYKKGTGLWDEDHVNDYKTNRYLSARATMRWYYEMERLQTRNSLNARRGTQSHNNNMGLHHSGRGAFEREVERHGLQVEKYALTTTTGATRVAELTLLRRLELEKKAEEAMAKQRAAVRQPAPSAWYDEALGPLNPEFLRLMQPHYEVEIKTLPEAPLIREQQQQQQQQQKRRYHHQESA
ncbi:putative LSU ribosomal protein, mitochondrial [Trypanosoma cruzi]|nr:putative LSU ribosomal protein, mitochondrial [Trypanosoma cruzi]